MKRFYFEPSSYCQLKCSLCPSKNFSASRRGDMDFNSFKKLIELTFDEGIISCGDDVHLYGFGEPTLNKRLEDMISLLSEKKITTKINTNGLTIVKKRWDSLKKSGLTKCLISIDGLDQETYEKYRVGGDFDLLNKNVYYICNNKNNIQIELQFIAFSHNQNQIDQFIEYSKRVNADIATIKKPRTWEGSIENYSGLIGLKNNSVRNLEKKGCRFQDDYGVVLQDGSLTICTADAFGKYVAGNIFQEGPKLWLSQKFRTIKHEARIKGLDICKNCGYDDAYIKKLHLTK